MKPKLCQKCLSTPCDRVKAIRRILGGWARERRRQLGDGQEKLFSPIPDKTAMETAVGPAVDEALAAHCDCECHKTGGRP